MTSHSHTTNTGLRLVCRLQNPKLGAHCTFCERALNWRDVVLMLYAGDECLGIACLPCPVLFEMPVKR